MRFCIGVFDETFGKCSCAGTSGGTVRPTDFQWIGRKGIHGHAENPGVEIIHRAGGRFFQTYRYNVFSRRAGG
jgi:hypothetical protein